MRYLSLFSGIEAASVAWGWLGWEPVAFAELDEFPSAVLAHQFPGIPNLGDVTKITVEMLRALGHIDIVVGGSPCQDMSIAGKRAGLKNQDGSTTRSGLFDEQIRIFELVKEVCGARFMLWENVPGAFSSSKGEDFRYVLESMVGEPVERPAKWRNAGIAMSGDGDRIVEWRVFDAQHFGVAQRRRRVFVILDVGPWWSRPPILFERDSMLGNTSKSKGKRKEPANRTEGSIGGRGAYSVRTSQTGANGIGVAFEKTHTLDCANGQAVMFENHPNDSRVTRCGKVAPTLSSRMGTGGGNIPLILASGQANAEICKDLCTTLNCTHEHPIFCGEEYETPDIS